ncbi:MAG: mechanosensitive ion channel [Desulfobacterales bacterium]|nr:mechanosensitive ion channel [Desulfobacterales bacterium]
MKKIIFLISFLVIAHIPLAWADSLISITSDDIVLNEPEFTKFIEQKLPFLMERVVNLGKEAEPLHLNVDFQNFEELWQAVNSYYSLKKDLLTNIDEYKTEAAQVREEIFKQKELEDTAAIKLILNYKFLKKNIDYSVKNLETLDNDFRMIFFILKSKQITAPAGEVKDLRSYLAFMLNTLDELRTKKITSREYDQALKAKSRQAALIDNGDALCREFQRLALEITDKGQLTKAVKSFWAGVNDTLATVYNYELYVVENKKITIGSILKIIALISFLILLYFLVKRVIYSRFSEEESKGYAAYMLSKYGVILAVILIVLFGLGLDLAKVTLLVSAVSVGIGFGLQKIFSNLVSGVILLLDKSIKLGDTIQIGDVYGTVTSMNARFVSLLTRDGREYLIPNERLIIDQVVNLTHSSSRFRLAVPVGISYASDLEQAMQLMKQAVGNLPRVLADPEPESRVIGFGDSSIDLELRIWITDPAKGIINVKSKVYLAIWNVFQQHNIVIPYPQRDVYLKSMPDISAAEENEPG